MQPTLPLRGNPVGPSLPVAPTASTANPEPFDVALEGAGPAEFGPASTRTNDANPAQERPNPGPGTDPDTNPDTDPGLQQDAAGITGDGMAEIPVEDSPSSDPDGHAPSQPVVLERQPGQSTEPVAALKGKGAAMQPPANSTEEVLVSRARTAHAMPASDGAPRPQPLGIRASDGQGPITPVEQPSGQLDVQPPLSRKIVQGSNVTGQAAAASGGSTGPVATDGKIPLDSAFRIVTPQAVSMAGAARSEVRGNGSPTHSSPSNGSPANGTVHASQPAAGPSTSTNSASMQPVDPVLAGARSALGQSADRSVTPAVARADALNAQLRAGQSAGNADRSGQESTRPSANVQPAVGEFNGHQAGRLPGHAMARPAAQQLPTATADPALSGAQRSDSPTLPGVQKGLTALANQKGGSLSMRLDPPSLGPLKLEMAIDSGRVRVQMLTASESARSLLGSNLGMLRSALEERGLIVERLVVDTTTTTTTSDSTSRSESRDQGGQDARNEGRDQAQQDASQGRSRGRRDRGEAGGRSQLGKDSPKRFDQVLQDA
ncbi:MAG: flagellar hook-length control protein FliK [Phycisphaerales bacterium]|nr:flagellar hook-length control protein FliK [Phycisphaerales bacterium]